MIEHIQVFWPIYIWFYFLISGAIGIAEAFLTDNILSIDSSNFIGEILSDIVLYSIICLLVCLPMFFMSKEMESSEKAKKILTKYI